MRRTFKKLVAGVLALSMLVIPAMGQPEQAKAAVSGVTYAWVHDPSIAIDKEQKNYYLFGSHIDAAKSSDLINWNNFTNGYATTNNKLYGNLETNLKKPFAWAGNHDTDCLNGYAVWAPDVFWNPNYVNNDGSKGAYMIYFCTSSTAIRSTIAFATSQNIEGPYEFADKGDLNPIVYSGFTKTSAKDNNSKVDKLYTNTNIDELINAKKLEGISSNWFSGNNYNNFTCPNAIDPNVFYDKSGKLWMSYGSWSGGIFILELDPATGTAKYPGKNSEGNGQNIIDSYFGKRIAGGNALSGEGPYIYYDKITDYYYLYVTYEFLDYKSGYNMRLFRSKNPDGPYTDAKGNNAALASGTRVHSDIGIRVMGNYKMPYTNDTYVSCGHNSAFINPNDNQLYLFYHARFAGNQYTHQIRVHQQFRNEDGWPVTAVYANKGDKISEKGYDSSEVVGDYSFINHGITKEGDNYKSATSIKLNANGTVTGDVTGTWSAKKDTYYMTLTYGGATYKGVFFKQKREDNSSQVMTFTAIGNNNMTIWGAKKPLGIKASKSTIYAGGNTGNTSQISLVSASGATGIKYSSSKSSVATVNSKGKVTAKKKGKTTITATFTLNGAQKKLTKKITVKKAYIKFSKKKAKLKVSKKYTYKAKGYGIKAKSIKFKSNKSSVLKVAKKGKATAKKKGKAKVIAYFKKIKATYKVTVK